MSRDFSAIMPANIKSLALDDRGYPIPYFATIHDGKPDFRVVDPYKFYNACKHDLCWVCGKFLGKRKVFTGGPASASQGVYSDLPSHPDCAMFSAQACPFLSIPTAKRNETNAASHKIIPGQVEENPGVTILYETNGYRIINNGQAIAAGKPTGMRWMCKGRDATRGEAEKSIVVTIEHARRILSDEGFNQFLKGMALLAHNMPEKAPTVALIE